MANKAKAKTATPKKELKKESFHPDYDTLLLKEVVAAERLSSGGIIIPETVENKDEDVNHGEIIEVGKSSKADRPFLWNVGDVVVFGVYNGRRIQFNGQELLLVRHMDVLGAVK
jgi:co-chaperonin GroES (HSP10)